MNRQLSPTNFQQQQYQQQQYNHIANQCNKKIAMVCASNQNRSLEAHNLFIKTGFKNIRSFGTSGHCKLPGPSIHQPNIFSFGTPYSDIYNTLKNQDQELYIKNGLLNMLERNKSVKLAPEKWQEELNAKFDIVFTFDQRVYDAVIEDLAQRDITSIMQPVHIINLQVKDTHDEAVVGARHALEITTIIENTGDTWEDHIDTILENFYRSTQRQLLHTLMFY